jgi:5-formyltetrahydrofolate cyclo-ligase
MPHDVPDTRDAAPVGDAMPVGVALHQAKRTLREDVIARRDALAPAVRSAAEARIAERIGAMPAFAAARVLLMTLPFRNEWDTRPLIAAAHAAGKRVALPRVDERTRMLELFEVTVLAHDVGPGYRGIDEPLAHCRPVAADAIDWVLVPGVGFDPDCRRLGYGGGFYDRLLPLLATAVPRIAGAFDVQVVERVPAAPHDIAVDAVITESRMYTR